MLVTPVVAPAAVVELEEGNWFVEVDLDILSGYVFLFLGVNLRIGFGRNKISCYESGGYWRFVRIAVGWYKVVRFMVLEQLDFLICLVVN